MGRRPVLETAVGLEPSCVMAEPTVRADLSPHGAVVGLMKLP